MRKDSISGLISLNIFVSVDQPPPPQQIRSFLLLLYILCSVNSLISSPFILFTRKYTTIIQNELNPIFSPSFAC
jgi:hypothetical protein